MALSPRLRVHLVVPVLWVAVWNLGIVMEFAPHASLWYPPAALTVAVIGFLGVRGIPAVLVAVVATTFQAEAMYGPPMPAAEILLAGLALGAVHCGAYGSGLGLLRRLAGDTVGQPTPRTIVSGLLVAPFASLAAAVGGVAVLLAAGMQTVEEARAIVFGFWIGDFVAVVTLAPFFLIVLGRISRFLGEESDAVWERLSRSTGEEGTRGRYLGKLALCLIVTLSAGILTSLSPLPGPASYGIFFVILPMMWITYTEGIVRTVFTVAAVSAVVALVARPLDLGPHVLSYQFAMIVVAGTCYFGLVVPFLYADNRRLSRLVRTDGLTGAATRHWFTETAVREVDRARRFGSPLSLILFDLDRFKEINDESGHAFGDRVLANIAERVRAELRTTDVLGRLGGEEFTVLLPRTDRDTAVRIAERIRSSIGSLPVQRGSTARTVTASFGVAEVDFGSEGWDVALERADEALYRAKRGGRDRVVAG